MVELFDLTVLIPEKLLEQMPPTLFVSAIAGEKLDAILDAPWGNQGLSTADPHRTRQLI